MKKKRLNLNLYSARTFVSELNKHDQENQWRLESEDGNEAVNARSMLGTIWATDSWDIIYLVNESHPGEYPEFMKKYFYLK